MRLGGPIVDPFSDPDTWIALLREEGYTAAYFPVEAAGDDPQAYAEAAQNAGIVIAEVGAWSNPLSPDPKTRQEAVKLCQERLALADAVGARCCVNISGSRGERWDGPHPDNLTDETFDLIVETVRTIIDAVKPTRTYYTLEPMPWMYPDSADSYLELLRAVDRRSFAVHFDPVNLICSPQRYYRNGDLIEDFVAKLGPHIVSCHAKDTLISEELTVHIAEVRPGLGELDYRTFLRAVARLDPDMPVMVEHLQKKEDYRLAAGYIRSVAQDVGISLQGGSSPEGAGKSTQS